MTKKTYNGLYSHIFKCTKIGKQNHSPWLFFILEWVNICELSLKIITYFIILKFSTFNFKQTKINKWINQNCKQK